MSLYCENGYCPQCRGEDKQYLLQLNSDDFWECPDCHLQILGMVPVFSVILPWRGSGVLKDNYYSPKDLHDTIITGYFEKDGFYTADPNNILPSRELMLTYIKDHVFENERKFKLNQFLES